MATNYPGSLDTSTQQPSPSASTEMDDSGFEHDVVHANHSGAIIAVETKVGTGASTPVADSVLGGTGSGTSAWTTTPTLGGLTVSGDAAFDTDTLFVDASQDRVGVNRSSPIFPLHAFGSTVDSIVGVESGDEGAYIAFVDSTSTGNVYDRRIGVTGDSLKFQTSATDRMTILSGGAVGIGTNSPANTFHVNGGTANFVARFESTDSEAYIGLKDSGSSSGGHVAVAAIGNDLVLRAGNSNAVRVKAHGDVGIGTTSPGQRLHVNSGATNTAAVFESTDTEVILGLKDDTTSGNAHVGIRATGDDLSLRAGNTNQVVIYSGGTAQFAGAVIATDGTASAPGLSFTSDTDTGMFREGANILALTTGGTKRVTVGSGGDVTLTGKLLAADGTASAPSLSFANDSNTGLYATGNFGVIQFSGNGTVGGYLYWGGVRTVTGSAGTPAYSFTDDSNTGMFRSAADELAFTTAGTQRVTIASDGDVGIGTTSPAHPLDVVGEARFSTSVQFNNGGQVIRNWGSGAIDNLLPGSTFGGILEGNSSGHFVIGIRDNDANDSFSVVSGGGDQTTNGYDTVVAYFGANGEVGIGTSSPTKRFHVNAGTTNATAVFESTDSGAYIGVKDNSTSGDNSVGIGAVGDALRLRAGDSNHLTITSGGNVGIGTTSPATPLHVSSSGSQAIRLTNTSSSTQGPYIGLYGSTTRVGYMGFPNNDDLYLKNETSSGLIYFATNDTIRVQISSGGVLQWLVSSGIGGPLTDTSSTSGFRYVLQNQTFGTLQDFTSIRDRKEQITNVTAADSGRWIDALQPVTYIERWLGEGEEPADNKQWREADMQVGFIADDVLANSDASHFAQATDNGKGGLDPSGWKWETVIAAAVAEIKSLRARVGSLENA